MQPGIGYTVTTDCLMVQRIIRLNLKNWKKIIVQLLQFINVK